MPVPQFVRAGRLVSFSLAPGKAVSFKLYNIKINAAALTGRKGLKEGDILYYYLRCIRSARVPGQCVCKTGGQNENSWED